jgi:Concanavalin A-like lectin/glucanases superfamily
VDTVGSTVTSPGQYPLSGFTPAYVASPSSSAVTFGGAQRLAVSGPVLDTKASFSVVARVRLGTLTPSAPMTIVSQDGSNGSGFRLQYRTDVDVDGDTVADKAWCFAMFSSDGAADATTSRSCMAAQATTSDWVTLAGVHDAVNHKVQLWIYVAAELQAVMIVPDTPFTSSWSATGALAIGGARQGGTAAQFWNGAIDRVAIIDQTLDANGLTTEMKKA